VSRYLGAKLRIIRRLGDLPGFTSKITERKYPPGQHGPAKMGKKNTTSDYSLRLQEKQKLRYNYGISEKQLYRYIKEARRLQGTTGTLLLQLLEMRLENVIFRLGFAPSIASARQFVTHCHVKVNGKNVNIPSFQCKPGDTFEVKKLKFIEDSIQTGPVAGVPPALHLELDQKNFRSKLKNQISRTEVSCSINEFLVIEYYSRKV
jgi:small subunit ribosomal protein S4